MRRRWRVAAATAALLGLTGCLDIGLATSVAFPPDIPGLDRGQPWVRLPVDSWVVESGIRPLAIAGCFAPACSPQAAVGFFRATGDEAARLNRVADDPQRLARAVLEGKPRSLAASTRPRPTVSSSAERIRERGWRGFAFHMGREDGTRLAHATVLTRPAAGSLDVLIVVSPAAEGALRIARDVVARAS